MGKTLKTVGAIVGGAVLIATGVGALAGFNVAAIGISTLTGSLTVGQLGTIASGLAAVGGALDKPKSNGAGNPSDWTSNPDQPVPFLFGQMGVAGKIVHRDEFGPNDNMYQAFVGILSGAGPIRSVLSFKADDQPVTFDGNGKANSSQWADEMWMRYRLGAQPDTALVSPSGLNGGATLPSWGSQHRLSGKACYLQVLGENSKRSAYPNGEPVPQHLCEGISGWDGRYDDTWPGGMGPCRFGVRSTYRYITDPNIAALNWALGLVENGKVVGGVGASRDGVDVDSFLQAANVSEANGWTISAWPDTSEDVSQVLNQMLQAGGASRARNAGRISCVTRGAVLPSVVTVTEADLAGPIELDTGASLFNRLTTITPKFMSPEAGWQPVAGSPVRFQDLIDEDGIETGDQIDYRFVPLAKQAAELAALDILDAREPFSGTVPLKPSMRRLKPGSRFTIDAPGLLLNGVKCLVLGRSYTAQTGESRISFRSETVGKVDLALGKTTSLPTFPDLSPPNRLSVTKPLADEWAIIPREPTEDGIQLPIWDLVGEVSNDTATAIIVEWAFDPAGGEPGLPPDPNSLAWNQVGLYPPTTSRVSVQGMEPGSWCYLSVRNVRGSNFSDRTLYGPEQVPGLVALTEADTEALDRLDRIDSDGWLTRGEKPLVLAQYETVLNEYPSIANRLNTAGLSAQLSAYNAATITLQNYINALSPALTDFTADTVIVGEDLRFAFEQYFIARQTGIDALLADARTRAVNAAADADEALDDIAVITSDAWLSKGEKPSIIEKFAVIQNETAALRAQGLAFGAVAQHDAYVAAYDALVAYLNSLSPAWNSLAVDTPVVGADLRFAFQSYYLRRQELLTAQLGITDADAGAALSRLAIIDSDGFLSKGEKPQVVREYEAIVAQFGPLRDQAALVGATTERTALIAAVDALNLYLGGLSPVWSDTASDTPIIGSTFRARFTAYYQAAQNTQVAISAAVGQDGSDALDRLLIIDSDNWLARGEKSEVIRLHQTLNGEFAGLNAQAVALGITTSLFAYFDALTALNSYLTGLTPAWDAVTVDTPIVGATFRSRFNDVFLTRTALQNAMVANLDDSIELVIDRLDDIASDSILSRNEKPEVIRQFNTISAERSGVVARLASVGVSSTAYVAAYDALVAYLGGLSPAWDNTALDTPIVGTTFRQKFVDYYLAKAAADNASIVEVGADAAAALAALDVIASDGFLSRGEKPAVIQQWATIAGETGPLRDQAAALGITGPRTTYVAAHDALGAYLASLSPAWDNISVDTPVVGADLRFAFQSYYVSKQALQNAIAAKLDTDIGLVETDVSIITSDNWLSRGEKPTLIREHGNFNTDYMGFVPRAAALGVTTALTTHFNALTAFNSYLAGLSPAWDNLAVDTPISGATLRLRLNDVYSSRQALLNAFTDVLDANADAALADLSIIASDNWLSRVEKPSIIQQFTTLNAEFSGLNDRAVALGITTPLFAYFDALTALISYIGGLSPAYTDTSVDTPIVGATLSSRFQSVYNTKTALQNAMFAATGQSVFRVTSSNPSRIGTRTGAGSVTSNTVTLTAVGATGSVSYSWERIFGDIAITATNASGASTAFSATLANGEQKQALFAWRATDSTTGIIREGQVGVGLISNA